MAKRRPNPKKDRANIRKPHQLREPTLGPPVSAGFILICDIVEFSRMEQPDQANAILRLLNFLEGNELLKARYDGEMNGTGDGALLAWSQRETPVTHGQLLDFAEELVAHMRGARRRIDLRIGIHVGQFRTVVPASRRLGIQLVGTGLNECARVSSLGDAGHIIVSEDFVTHWRRAGHFKREDFFPEAENPIVAFVKHNEPLGIRVYRGAASGASLPERLLKLISVDALMMQTLTQIENSFAYTLSNWLRPNGSPSLSRDQVQEMVRKLSARISVLSPASTNGIEQLFPTEYRHHQDPLLRGKGKTPYLIDGSKIEGPLALAFTENKPQVVHRLPLAKLPTGGESNGDFERYCAMFSEHGVGREKIAKMSRLARSYLAFPFGLPYLADPLNSRSRRDPDGVICLDLGDPLEEFEEPQLRACMMETQQYFNSILSALWRLRTS